MEKYIAPFYLAIDYYIYLISDYKHKVLKKKIIKPQFQITITKQSGKPKASDMECLFHTCFDVYHCGYDDDNRITIYVYPLVRYVDEAGLPLTVPMSRSVFLTSFEYPLLKLSNFR